MKKFLPFAVFALFAATMPFSFVSCGSDDDEEDRKFKNEEFNVGQVSFTMVAVEGGNFMMGAPEADSEAMDREKPQHKVTLSNFYIGETVVTQALWKAVMGTNPSYPQGMLLPVNGVSWDDCQTFIVKLNQMTGKKFRLPTEAEWEYAARGGKKSKGFKYAGSDNLDEVAWYAGNATESMNPDVKKKKSNELGLYDMTGYVWEWCQDLYAEDYYINSPAKNPCNTASGKERVLRGGDKIQSAKSCRVTVRNHKDADSKDMFYGFRLAMDL